jgi:tetratricopeptide (TPR) repeat protein
MRRITQQVLFASITFIFLLTQGCDESPYHPDAMSLQREAMKVYKRKPDSALSVLDKAIAIDPSYHISYNTKAMVLQRKGELEKAIAELHKSLRWNDNQPEVHLQIGMLHDVANRPEKASDAYLRAIALFDMHIAQNNAPNGDHEVNRAIASILNGEQEKGNERLERCANDFPDHPVLSKLIERKEQEGANSIDRAFLLRVLVIQP